MANKKDEIFRLTGIIGLILLLVLFSWDRNRNKNPVSETTEVAATAKDEHDHADPAAHGDVTGKQLVATDNILRPSGNLHNGKRVVSYEAFKFAFAPDPLIVRSGEIVTLKLKSRDVEHGMMIPEIDFNASMPVNKIVPVSFKAPLKPGKYPIFCSTYCGSDHGKMQGTLLVLPVQ